MFDSRAKSSFGHLRVRSSKRFSLSFVRPEKGERPFNFPPTEMMLLTGLRWGEAVGILWSDVSWAGSRVHIRRAVVRGEDDLNEPTKTAAKWSIVLSQPLGALLRTQQERTPTGRSEDRVFPGLRGGPVSYPEWLLRGWRVAIRRAGVSPRDGDAQKALRRS